MAGLTGLTGLYPAVVQDPEQSPDVTQGPSADPRHASEVIQEVYPWQVPSTPGRYHGPYGIYNEILGVDDSLYPLPEGYGVETDIALDRTPVTHAAPTLTLGPEDSNERDLEWQSLRARASNDIHSYDLGAKDEKLYNIPPVNQVPIDSWDWVDPGSSNLSPNVPAQIKGLRGLDRLQGMTVQNEHGFDSSHDQHRFPMPGVPGNFLWMQPGSRPLIVEPYGQTNRRTGEDSPFAGQDPSSTYGVQGAALQQPPAQYEAPPEPYVAPGYPEQGPTVWGSDFIA